MNGMAACNKSKMLGQAYDDKFDDGSEESLSKIGNDACKDHL